MNRRRRSAHARDIAQLKEITSFPTSDQPSGHRTPVSEDDPERTWRPHRMCPDQAANVVLEIMLRCGEISQKELAYLVAAEMEVPIGTARAYVSGALLAFRETGWVECIVPGKRPTWRVIE